MLKAWCKTGDPESIPQDTEHSSPRSGRGPSQQVCEEQATSTGKGWYEHSYACPETVEDVSYFSTLSRLPSYSHLSKSAYHHPYCHMSPNGWPIRQGYTSMSSVSRELSLFCPIDGGIPKGGDSTLGVSLHSRHAMPAIQSAQSPL